MHARLNHRQASPEGMKTLTDMRAYLANCGLDPKLRVLAWAEALTLIAETHAPDHVYNEVSAQFSDKELVDLSLAIADMNAWNRIGIGFRPQPVLRV